MEKIETTNTLTFEIAKLLPKGIKKFLRFAIKILEPRVFRLFDPIEGVLWLSYNPRYQLKKAIYNFKRNRQLKKMDIELEIPNRNFKFQKGSIESPKIMTVIPYWENSSDEFCSGDIFTEIYLSSRDRFGPLNTKKISGLMSPNWIHQASDEVLNFDPSHLIVHVEQDPIESKWWSLDIFLSQLRNFGWMGNIVLVSYDSVWDSTKLHIDRITNYVQNVTVVSIDRPYLRKSKEEVSFVGPVILPLSLGTLNALQDMRSTNKSQSLDITFFGRKYGYREKFLGKLSFDAITQIKVNPQGSGAHYRSYLEALGKATSTIDFSRASGQNLKQFKCRIIEASLLGCIVITDGVSLINQVYPGFKVIGFKQPRTLENVIRDFTNYRSLSLEVNTSEYFSLMENLAQNSFWDQVVG